MNPDTFLAAISSKSLRTPPVPAGRARRDLLSVKVAPVQQADHGIQLFSDVDVVLPDHFPHMLSALSKAFGMIQPVPNVQPGHALDLHMQILDDLFPLHACLLPVSFSSGFSCLSTLYHAQVLVSKLENRRNLALYFMKSVGLSIF